MTNETIQPMNVIAMLNARNQNIVMAINDMQNKNQELRTNWVLCNRSITCMQNENQELQNQLGSLQVERNVMMEQYEDIKGQVEAMLPKILKIKEKSSTLAMFTCAPSESPFEQFVSEANELLGDIMVDPASP
ncbi:hypothetical protein ACFE04_000628 [Oxalis oulophora]